jgi:site-specific recombinase XerD
MTHFGPFDPTEGELVWQQTVRAWLQEARDVPPEGWTLKAAAGRYVQHRAAIGCSPRGAAAEYYRLNLWIRWAHQQGADHARDVDRPLILSFLTRCQAQAGYAKNTIVSYRQLLSLFTKFLLSQRALHRDPMLGMRVGRTRPTGPKYVLTAAELNVLVAALARRADCPDPRWGWHYRRDLLMCKVLIATGIRVSELCALCWRDFDAAGTLTVAGKGSGPFAIRARRVFVCDPHLLRELQQWHRGQGHPERALFPPRRSAPTGKALTPGAIDRLVKSWAALAGLGRPLHAHLFRHTFCSHLIANGADVYSVQQLMGHRRVEVTLAVYLHLTEGEVREQWQLHAPLATAGR